MLRIQYFNTIPVGATLGAPTLGAGDFPINIGSRGEAVRLMQAALCVLGYRGVGGARLAVDGIYGANTENAVRGFYRIVKWPDRSEVTEARYNTMLAEARRRLDGQATQAQHPGGTYATNCADALRGVGGGGAPGGDAPVPASTAGVSPILLAAVVGVGLAYFTRRGR